MKTYLFAAAVIVALSAPAAAAMEFYLALDTSAQQCRVMSTPPDGTVMKRLDDRPYESMADAEKAMARRPECSS